MAGFDAGQMPIIAMSRFVAKSIAPVFESQAPAPITNRPLASYEYDDGVVGATSEYSWRHAFSPVRAECPFDEIDAMLDFHATTYIGFLYFPFEEGWLAMRLWPDGGGGSL